MRISFLESSIKGKGAADAVDGGLGGPECLVIERCSNGCRQRGCCLQGQRVKAFHVGVSDLSGCSLSRFIKESVEAFVEKSMAPFADALATESHLGAYVVVGVALGAGKYNTGT